MQGYNLLAVFKSDLSAVLMCRRLKEPYLGLINFTGGKIEKGEDGFAAAYRELYEETSITDKSITLRHLMDFTYPLDDCYVEVYAGRLSEEVTVSGNENELFWQDNLDDDFFDMKKYAGEGNIGHIMEHIRMNKERLF